MQLTLPFPLFLLFDWIIGTSKGPNGSQSELLDFGVISLNFNHSFHKEFEGKNPFTSTLDSKKSIVRAYGLYPFPFVYGIRLL